MNIKYVMAVLFMLTLSHVAIAKKTSGDFLNTKSVDRANQWVVAPGTRVMAGNPLEDEFYILGAADAFMRHQKTPMKVASKKKAKAHIASRQKRRGHQRVTG